MARKRFFIVGDGAAGFTAAQTLRTLEPDAIIVIVSDDPSPAYFRAALTNYLLGELREDQLWAAPPDFYGRWQIHRVFARVIGIEGDNRRIHLSSGGAPEPFDAVLVASGARARSPTFPGSHLDGVLTLRTIADVHHVLERLRTRRPSHAVVVGGGALGLEWAHGLREHGLGVTIAERSPRFLQGVLDHVASDLLAARLTSAGIGVRLQTEVAEVYAANDGSVRGLTTNAGETIWCELVAAAMGVTCNSELLRGSGVALADNGAVIVDRHMRTNVPGVFAAGDVATVDGKNPQLWEPAKRQAVVAAKNMVGGAATYDPGSHYFATRLFDLDFASVGAIADDPALETLVDFSKGTGRLSYRKLAIHDGKLVGAIMLGERSARVRANGRVLKKLIDTRTPITTIRESLLDRSFDVAAWFRRRELMAPPRATTRKAAPSAKVRGTQVLALAGAGGADRAPTGTAQVGAVGAAPSAGATAGLAAGIANGTIALRMGDGDAPEGPTNRTTVTVANVGPRETRVLSIGLRAEAPAPDTGATVPEAHFELNGRAHRLTASPVLLGQDPEAAIRIDDPTVATRHAQIVAHAGAWWAYDLGSRTGTWVAGALLSSAHELRDGDVLRIGRTDLVFRSSVLPRVAREPEASAVAPRLEVRSGSFRGLAFALGSGEVTVGRGASATLRIDDPGMDATHVSARLHEGRCVLTALSPSLPTWYRGQTLAPGQAVYVEDGEMVRMGTTDVAFTTAPLPRGSRALARRARIHVVQGSDAGRTLVTESAALVGSQSGCALTLADPVVAPSHIEIGLVAEGWTARDLSGGRTFLRGTPLAPHPTLLGDGDVLLLGGAVMLRFEEIQ